MPFLKNSSDEPLKLLKGLYLSKVAKKTVPKFSATVAKAFCRSTRPKFLVLSSIPSTSGIGRSDNDINP